MQQSSWESFRRNCCTVAYISLFFQFLFKRFYPARRRTRKKVRSEVRHWRGGTRLKVERNGLRKETCEGRVDKRPPSWPTGQLHGGVFRQMGSGCPPLLLPFPLRRPVSKQGLSCHCSHLGPDTPGPDRCEPIFRTAAPNPEKCKSFS